jgi:hypothetical protein
MPAPASSRVADEPTPHQAAIDQIIAKEQLSIQKIRDMHGNMNMLKNKIRLEQEMAECERRISFLHRLRDTNPHVLMSTTSNNSTCNGYKMWTGEELALPVIKRKLAELMGLFVREEKLRAAFEGIKGVEREEEGRGCASRMGLLKECIDRYTALLPEHLLNEGLDGGGRSDIEDVVVRRNNASSNDNSGREYKATVSIDRLSVDRFDDRDFRVELFVNNELVSKNILDSPFSIKKYNSAVGARLEFYVYAIESEPEPAIAMAAFSVISSIEIEPQRIYMEPRGHFYFSVTFTPIDRKKELRRGNAITKTRQQASRSAAILHKHHFKVGNGMLPVQCSHCNTVSFHYLRCLDCGLAAHQHCAPLLVNDCIVNSHHDEGKKPSCLATFDVPHLFKPDNGLKAWEWCLHCGRHLWAACPTSNKNVLKCSECKRCCHEDCVPYIPAHCGLSDKLKKALPLTASFDSLAVCNQPTMTSPLQQYEMLRTIGRGSFGKVLVANHKHTKRLVAIKVLKKSDINKHAEFENVQTEFRILSLIKRYKDPFCIGLLDVFQTRERVYFVSEFVPGGDLMYHIQVRPFTDIQVQYRPTICS